MSCIQSAGRMLATLAVVGLAGAALSADPPPNPVPLADAAKKQAPSCGELPRGGRAFKECIAAQSRRDAAPGSQPAVKPALSSR